MEISNLGHGGRVVKVAVSKRESHWCTLPCLKNYIRFTTNTTVYLRKRSHGKIVNSELSDKSLFENLIFRCIQKTITKCSHKVGLCMHSLKNVRWLY